MTIGSNLNTFKGKAIEFYNPETGISNPNLVYKIGIDWDGHEEGKRVETLLESFANDPNASKVKEIVIGCWDFEGGNSSELVAAFVKVKDKLPALQYIFMGDITYEETEMSWIENSLVTPILEAYPALLHFQVRGGNSLSFEKLRHSNLKTLIVETGGMSKSIIDEIIGANLPNLEHLELWLGDDGYGCDIAPADLKPLLEGVLFPKLKYLGLCNYYRQDELALAIAHAPILDRIETLDLSKGNICDEGGNALLNSPAITKLKKLDLSHHYLSNELMAKFKKLNVEINLDDQNEGDEYDGEVSRYIMVSE